MKIFVGTSGWMYSWNPNGFEWYLRNSDLNAVELNASFYRFPFPSQVKGWANKMKIKKIRWSIKVNRFVTHVFKFSERAFKTWEKFRKLFKPLDEYIDFYLFQLPPILTPKSASRIASFYKKTKLEQRFALEWRNLKWFSKEWIGWAKNLGLTLVSVDAPDFTKFPREIYCTNGIVYLRMHGRSDWYSHFYTSEELEEVKQKVLRSKADKAYIFFNNNHAMLSNAISMFKAFGVDLEKRKSIRDFV